MTDYFFTCTLISLSLLLTVIMLRQAPARLSFYLLIIALSAWLVPWQHLPALTEADNPIHLSLNIAEFFPVQPTQSLQTEQTTSLDASRKTVQENGVNQLKTEHLVWAILFTGLSLFLYRIIQYFRILQYLKKHSIETTQYQSITSAYPVRLAKLKTPALATGLFCPTIWLDEEMQNREELTSVLQHEVNHLKQFDTVWTWFICIIESLFWWNPLCLYLAKQTKQQLELSCDEKCFSQLAERYQYDLASLLLSKNPKHEKQVFAVPLLSIKHHKNFNIQRIKFLNKEKTMKVKYVCLAIASLLLSSYTAASVVHKQSSFSAGSDVKLVQNQNYQTQLNQLIELSKNVRTDDKTELKSIYQNILAWQNNRHQLTGPEDGKLKLYAFTVVNNVLYRLEQFQEIIATYNLWYGEDTKPPFFLYNHLAGAHMKLNQPEQAVAELKKLKSETGDRFQPGSKLFLSQAYAMLKNEEKALEALNSIEATDLKGLEIHKYFIYKALGDNASITEMEQANPSLAEQSEPNIILSSPIFKMI